jgi:hypothetical protein
VPIIPLGFSVEDVKPFASGAGADGGAAVLSAWEAAERLAVDDRLATSGCGSGLGGPYGFIGKSIEGRLEVLVDMALDGGRLQGRWRGRSRADRAALYTHDGAVAGMRPEASQRRQGTSWRSKKPDGGCAGQREHPRSGSFRSRGSVWYYRGGHTGTYSYSRSTVV